MNQALGKVMSASLRFGLHPQSSEAEA
jgi:hypothetical protein